MDGRIRYGLRTAVGEKWYDDIYNLTLQDFQLCDPDKNGFFEPGQKIRITKIRVENTGKMPTPAHQSVTVYVINHGCVLSNEKEITIPKSLSPGEEYEFPEFLPFKIRSTTISTVGDRMVATNPIELGAQIAQVNRGFSDFDKHPRTMIITFPLELTEIQNAHSVCPGEYTRILFGVTNVSSKPLGLTAETAREIGVLLKSRGGRLENDDIFYVDSFRRIVDIATGSQFKVPLIDPGKTVIVEKWLGISNAARPHSYVELRASLQLDSLEGAKANVIQNRVTQIRIAQPYRLSQDPGILLVTNKASTEDEVNAWKDLAKELGVALDIWDLSYYGRLNFEETVNGNLTIRQAYKNKCVIILNNQLNSNANISTEVMLSRKDFMRAASENGIRFVVLGGKSNENDVVDKFLLAIPEASATKQTFSEADYLIKLDQNAPNHSSVGLSKFDEIACKKTCLFSSPGFSSLRLKSRQLQEKIAEVEPGIQSTVAYNFAPKTLTKGRFGYFCKEGSLGTVLVHRTPRLRYTIGISDSLSDQDLHNRQYILSDRNRLTVAMASPNFLKLQLLSRAFHDSVYAKEISHNGFGNALMRAYFAEIAAEVNNIFKESGSNKSNSEVALKILLEELKNMKLPSSLDPKSESGLYFNTFLSDLERMSWDQISWISLFNPCGSKKSIVKKIRDAASDLLAKAYSDDVRRVEAKNQIDRTVWAPPSKESSVKNKSGFLSPILSNGIRYGHTFFSTASDYSVISIENWRIAQDKELDRQKQREEFTQSIEGERRKFSISGQRLKPLKP